tara:strand:- start:945 stop:1766 length:822 start_codon:yes stop_codon:yes gene_type:complete
MLIEHLHANSDVRCIDLGPYDDTSKVDYVDYANLLSRIVGSEQADCGVLICGTGVGMSIAANRHENVRAALVHNTMTAPKCRDHNNSNVLCLGNWTTTDEENLEILDLWMNTSFGEGRHVKRVEKLSKARKNSVVLANGVFDILHTGHIELIKFSKNLGDYLVIALNSDESVRQLKGPTRPINNQQDRKKMLLSISEVDEVVIFDEIDTKKIIASVNPDTVVKGGEWTASEVRTRDEIPNEIDIKIFDLVSDRSTTDTIKKIHSMPHWQKDER